MQQVVEIESYKYARQRGVQGMRGLQGSQAGKAQIPNPNKKANRASYLS